MSSAAFSRRFPINSNLLRKTRNSTAFSWTWTRKRGRPAVSNESIAHNLYWRDMFETLSDKLQRVFKNLRGEGRLSEAHLDEALKEIRMALLEADVNFKVVKQFTDTVKTKALGQEVMQSLSPGQQVVKIVRDELIEMLGGTNVRINFAPQPPSVIMLVGLQGSGKT